MATLESLGDQRTRKCLSTTSTIVGKPPPDINNALALPTSAKSPYKMSDGRALLGWHVLVAPTSKTALSAHAHFTGTPQGGAIHKLPGRGDATYEMAPTLCDAVRCLVETKQIRLPRATFN